MCYLQTTGTFQLIFKSELPSLTGDGGEHKEIALGAVSKGEEKPSGCPQEIGIKTLPAFADSQLLADLKTPFCLNNLTWKENCIQVFLLATGFTLWCTSPLG